MSEKALSFGYKESMDIIKKLEHQLLLAEELLASASFLNECNTIQCKSCLEHISLIRSYFREKESK